MARITSLVCTLAFIIAMTATTQADQSQTKSLSPSKKSAGTIAEARMRARLLHEAFHGALQVMHRDFFDEDNARVLPSASLDDVFAEMQRSHGVTLRWLAVNAKAMNVDHEPEDQFEKNAVKALSSGKKEYESVEHGRFRYVGTIRLASQCLKCHLPNRKSTKDRAAGLSISMEVATAAESTIEP